jgi:nitronate monooxygenase
LFSGASGAALAAETCRAGALGFLAAGHLNSKESLQALEREIELFQELSDGNFPLAIGFIGHSTFGSELGWNLFENVLENYQPQVVLFFAPAISFSASDKRDLTYGKRDTNVVELSHSFGCKVVAQVGSVADGLQALEAGVDCLIAQGTEAGGHGLRREHGCGTLSLTAQLVKCAGERPKRVPVLAAGGIMDGRGLVAALSLGADGAVLGTRLWASKEAKGPSCYKEALVAAKSADDVVRTRTFDAIWNSYRTTKWPEPYDSSGALRNEITDSWDDKMNELEKELRGVSASSVAEAFKRADAINDASLACVFSGKGVGQIDAIEPAFEIIARIETEAIETMKNFQSLYCDTD